MEIQKMKRNFSELVFMLQARCGDLLPGGASKDDVAAVIASALSDIHRMIKAKKEKGLSAYANAVFLSNAILKKGRSLALDIEISEKDALRLIKRLKVKKLVVTDEKNRIVGTSDAFFAYRFRDANGYLHLKLPASKHNTLAASIVTRYQLATKMPTAVRKEAFFLSRSIAADDIAFALGISDRNVAEKIAKAAIYHLTSINWITAEISKANEERKGGTGQGTLYRVGSALARIYFELIKARNTIGLPELIKRAEKEKSMALCESDIDMSLESDPDEFESDFNLKDGDVATQEELTAQLEPSDQDEIVCAEPVPIEETKQRISAKERLNALKEKEFLAARQKLAKENESWEVECKRIADRKSRMKALAENKTNP